jgi:PST family polysaccharide transporter
MKVGTNALWLVGERLCRIVVGLLVTLWVARYLGPDQYGELSFAIAFAALMGALAGLGLDQITVRDIARNPQVSGDALGTAMGLRLAGSAIATALGLAVVVALGTSGNQLTIVALAMASLVFQAADVVDYWFQSQLRSRLTVTAKLVAMLSAAALKIVLILTHASVVAFAALFLVEAALFAIAMAVAYRRDRCATPWRWNAALARRMLADGLPIMLSSAAIMVYMRIDQIMLRELAGPTQLGLFAAVLPFSEGWYILATSVCASLLPSFSRLHAEDQPAFKARLSKLLRVLAGSALLISAFISLTADPMVSLLLGERFLAAGPVLAIHVWGVVFVFLGVAENLWLVSDNRRLVRLCKTTAGALVNVALNWVLIPRLGAQGAAIATVVSFAVAAYFSNFILAPEVFRMQTRALLLRQ